MNHSDSKESKWRHFLSLQTHPGIFKQVFFFLFAFLVLQAPHESGVPADVGFPEGKLVGLAVGDLDGMTDGTDDMVGLSDGKLEGLLDGKEERLGNDVG